MSTALVKRSLSLFDDDFVQEPNKKNKVKDPLAVISTRKKGVKKELRKLQRKQQMRKQTTSKSSDHRNSDDEYQDFTELSVQALSRLSQIDRSDNSTSTVVFEHHHQRKRGKHVSSEKVSKSEEKTAFSDKDFEDFYKTFDFSKHSKKS